MSDKNAAEGDSKYLFDLLKKRYEERLNPQELEEVKKGVANIQLAADKLRSVKLENSDEPYALFVPYRERG
ncbi:hypothetical protein JY97_05425 [Alkalispirochaeta odontotermitis]|nr:hypothetical protein JY97_05425 [Alkalispirochaeta odontotermitis]CAB1083901.1 hypothetical protein D1AOALGA4SA_11435 [Olavius algarvensis Delta 1 endosymbiont]